MTILIFLHIMQKNTVFAYDTEFNGNYISLKTDIRYLNFHKGAIINTNLSRCVIIGPSYLVPYIIGEGIPKSSLDMSFSINVWTGMDTLK